MSALRILVLGANGMLGHAVLRTLAARADWTVHGTQVEDPRAPYHLNAESDPEQWAPLFRGGYDYAINCIGVLKPAIDERNPASLRRAITVNALFPQRLAEVVEAGGTRILHMSTDGVFSGASPRPYLESDPTDCPDAYGKTKALGECPAPNVLNIRCSIVGRDPVWRKGLIEWVLGAADNVELSGFEDQTWNGVSTLQFAALCRRILESGAFHRVRSVSPVHHFCPNSAITKYDLLCLIQQLSRKNVVIRRARSGAGRSSRVLATRYQELSSLYPAAKWPEVIRQALADTPE